VDSAQDIGLSSSKLSLTSNEIYTTRFDLGASVGETQNRCVILLNVWEEAVVLHFQEFVTYRLLIAGAVVRPQNTQWHEKCFICQLASIGSAATGPVTSGYRYSYRLSLTV